MTAEIIAKGRRADGNEIPRERFEEAAE